MSINSNVEIHLPELQGNARVFVGGVEIRGVTGISVDDVEAGGFLTTAHITVVAPKFTSIPKPQGGCDSEEHG